jgi:CBS domain-containing protein
MTSDVRTCRPETNLAEAVRDMWEGDCGALPVVSDEGRVIGMITDRDVCIAVATRGGSADASPSVRWLRVTRTPVALAGAA